MSNRIHFRPDQDLSLRRKYSTSETTVFAPIWVKQALNNLGEHFEGATFELFQTKRKEGTPPLGTPLETIEITRDFNHQSLTVLQKIARNERFNFTGIINTSLYQGIEKLAALFSLRDLVRQTIIVGIDECTQYGENGQQKRQRVYICDLAALQFQQEHNSGRLVLIQQEEGCKGILDDHIYSSVVKEREKKTYDEVKNLLNGSGSISYAVKQRYWAHDGFGMIGKKCCFFDSKAYKMFVERDVILCGLAVCEMVETWHPEDKIHFKFLKYGTGYYAGEFGEVLNKLILPAVLDGVEVLLKQNEVTKIIKCFELPFYDADESSKDRIERMKIHYNTEIIVSKDDALKKSHKEGLIVATTNCGDCHSPFGTEMNHHKVFESIAENIKSKGNIFCPNINMKMSGKYITIP